MATCAPRDLADYKALQGAQDLEEAARLKRLQADEQYRKALESKDQALEKKIFAAEFEKQRPKAEQHLEQARTLDGSARNEELEAQEHIRKAAEANRLAEERKRDHDKQIIESLLSQQRARMASTLTDAALSMEAGGREHAEHASALREAARRAELAAQAGRSVPCTACGEAPQLGEDTSSRGDVKCPTCGVARLLSKDHKADSSIHSDKPQREKTLEPIEAKPLREDKLESHQAAIKPSHPELHHQAATKPSHPELAPSHSIKSIAPTHSLASSSTMPSQASSSSITASDVKDPKTVYPKDHSSVPTAHATATHTAPSATHAAPSATHAKPVDSTVAHDETAEHHGKLDGLRKALGLGHSDKAADADAKAAAGTKKPKKKKKSTRQKIMEKLHLKKKTPPA